MIRPADLRDDDVWDVMASSRAGDLERVTGLVSRRPELARCEYNYTPPLHFAVREGHLGVVTYLVDGGADVSYRTYPFGDSLLTMARDREHTAVGDFLFETLARRFPIVEGIGAFLDAAERGNLDEVRSTLARDVSLARASTDTGDTALHRAALAGQLGIVLALLDAGADPNATRADGVRPIHVALKNRPRGSSTPGALVDALLVRGAEYNIYIAAVLGDIERVRNFLAHDRTLANFEDSSHYRPISTAASRNDLEMVKLLLEHGANPSLPELGAPLGGALWWAVHQRQLEMARLLLEHGANPNTAPESSGSALFQARKDPELSRLLLAHGARDDAGDLSELSTLVGDNRLVEVEEFLRLHPGLDFASASWGEGILAGPANQGRREMIQLLMRFGARVPDVTKWGPYYYFKHVDTAQLLLSSGMNPNHMNWHRFTLLHHMAAEGDVPKARLLLDHGAHINAVDEEYRSTPLGCAARWGRRDMVTFLLERGADPGAAGAPWATPLAWSRTKGHADIEAVLRNR
jgi:ankyrin repeat protein